MNWQSNWKVHDSAFGINNCSEEPNKYQSGILFGFLESYNYEYSSYAVLGSQNSDLQQLAWTMAYIDISNEFNVQLISDNQSDRPTISNYQAGTFNLDDLNRTFYQSFDFNINTQMQIKIGGNFTQVIEFYYEDGLKSKNLELIVGGQNCSDIFAEYTLYESNDTLSNLAYLKILNGQLVFKSEQFGIASDTRQLYFAVQNNARNFTQAITVYIKRLCEPLIQNVTDSIKFDYLNSQDSGNLLFLPKVVIPANFTPKCSVSNKIDTNNHKGYKYMHIKWLLYSQHSKLNKLYNRFGLKGKDY
ncbi:UNKNOWN [Stylonychia lemnae]|uniref:Uncharacterized protein n=1 Tax=Stylonychia lemnae TaxID=5949 RepID=A0A078A5R7_STYLE|nr:UNKNOWN [Stylonychia lemnae]|eukprot:CDW77590.1 UNKNOWN [Stylonychia lemnae]